MGLIASMTGYGRGEARGSRLAVVVEARSLNHRFLEVGLKVPRAFSAHETELRQLAQGRVSRGRLDVAVGARRIAGSPSVVRADLGLGAEYVRGARALAEALGLSPDLPLGDLLRLPGVVTVEEAEEDDGEARLLFKEAAEQALDELVRMRYAEGAALAADLLAHLRTLDTWVAGLERLLPEALPRIRERHRGRIHTLLEDVPVDPARIAQEAAMLAARSDVAEELARLVSHCGQFRALLAAGGAVGRQLDFLAQEMHREVNTIASKADDGELVARILEARTVVERLREQVQNVE
ncbi:MAG: YicC family protein [Candidatus Rokubacteria bacterium]|nr:YicC family protein [Candidatus Rokubacteria bacterium]